MHATRDCSDKLEVVENTQVDIASLFMIILHLSSPWNVGFQQQLSVYKNRRLTKESYDC